MKDNSTNEEGQLTDFILDVENLSVDRTDAALPFANAELSRHARYFPWKDITHGDFTFKDIVLRITDDDICTMTFVVHQDRKFYTHTRNRRSWTGPRPSLVLLDHGRVPIGDVFQMRQINRICEQRTERFIEHRKIVHAFALTVALSLSFSSYRAWLC